MLQLLTYLLKPEGVPFEQIGILSEPLCFWFWMNGKEARCYKDFIIGKQHNFAKTAGPFILAIRSGEGAGSG